MHYTILAQKNCKPCQDARELLYEKGETYIEVIYVDSSPFYRRLMKMADLKTTPQIFNSKGEHIGGFDDLKKSLR